MNGKAAKRLRRQAEQKTVGLKWNHKSIQSQTNHLGRVTSFKIVNSADCGRGVYQTLKKEQNNGSR